MNHPTPPLPTCPAFPRPAAIGAAFGSIVVAAFVALASVPTHVRRVLIAVRRDERGQATTEYALVLLAAALVALLVIAWATAGGGAARVGRLFDSVIDAVIDRV